MSALPVIAWERWSRTALAIFAVSAVASIALQNFVFLAIAAWLISMGMRRQWRLTATPMNWPLLLLAVVLIAASLWAGRMNSSIFGLRKVGLVAIFFVTTAMITQPLKAQRALQLFIGGAVFCAVWSIIAYSLGWAGDRARSFSGDYMAAGGMYMMAFIIALSQFIYHRGRQQWQWLIAAGILGLALLLTYTRSAWIGAAVGLLILGMFRDWRLPAAVLGLLALFLVSFPQNSVSQRIMSIASKYNYSNVERQRMWVTGLRLLVDRPLQGYGVDNLSEVYERYVDPQALEKNPPHVHNTTLQLALNGGVLAVVFYVWWVFAVLCFGVNLWRKNRQQDNQWNASIIGITAAFAGFLVNGLFEFNFGTAQVITIVYFLTGLLPALGQPKAEAGVWALPKKPRLLFVRPRFRGDVLLASMIPRLIKRDYPHAQVDLLTEPGSAEAAQGNAGWDNIIVLDRRARGEWWRVVRELRRRYYDVAADLFGNPRSAMLVFASGAEFKIGPQITGWDLLLHAVTQAAKPGPRPAWESYFDVLRALGMKQFSTRPRWEVSREDDLWVANWLKQKKLHPKKIIGIFAGATHPAKRWPVAHFLQVAKAVYSRWHLRSVFVFGPLDGDAREQYLRLAGKMSLAVDGLTPGQLAALWSQCALLISNDAFPMHMGPAVGTPTLGLFGPGDPRVWFPYSGRAGHRVLHVAQACWPCHRDECSSMRCWEELLPEQVVAAVGQTLEQKRVKE